MNISKKQLFKQIGLVALLSLPFTPSLEAAGWFDAVRSSRIGQWFSEQPKAAQIGMGVGAMATIAAAAYYGYQSLTANSIVVNPTISLNAVNIKQLDDYRIYAFGTESPMSQKDIDDVTSVLKESDTSVCSTQEKRFLFPSGWLFDRQHLAAFGGDRELRANAFSEEWNMMLSNNVFFTGALIDIMRNSQDEFVGVLLSGVHPNDTQRTYILFVAPAFRNKGCAKKLVNHHAQNLLAQGITEISFSACKSNPACKWYDSLGFKRSNSGEGYWKYSGTIAQ